jgi:hypothetical protein
LDPLAAEPVAAAGAEEAVEGEGEGEAVVEALSAV